MLSTDDKYLFAGQAGLDINPHRNLSGKFGVAFYDYVHTRGVANSPAYPYKYDWTAPAYQQKGNTLFDIQPTGTTALYALAANYRELNLTGAFDIAFWKPIHVVLTGDYVNNLGFNRASVERLTQVADVPNQTQGYLVGLTVGYPEIKKRWEWRVYGYYKYLEADAVIDAFTDPEFHRAARTPKAGCSEADLGLGKNLWTDAQVGDDQRDQRSSLRHRLAVRRPQLPVLGGCVKKKVIIGALGLLVGVSLGLIYSHVQLATEIKAHQAKLKEIDPAPLPHPAEVHGGTDPPHKPRGRQAGDPDPARYPHQGERTPHTENKDFKSKVTLPRDRLIRPR